MREACRTLVKLPMRDGVESLNLSVAAGVMLYAARECARTVLEEGLERGIARVILSASDLGRLQRGDVLVTISTPIWRARSADTNGS